MLRRLLTAGARALYIVALPLALVLTSIRGLTFDPGYYLSGYERYGVAGSTGMTREQLAEATAQIQGYFRGGPPVSLVVDKEWGREPLFNGREQQHLADVRDLLTLALRVQEASIAYLLATAAWLLAIRRRPGVRRLGAWLTIASGVTLSLFAVLGLLALVDFESFWTRFHLLSFTNDLWLLDPRTDYMIRLFPLGFWFDAVLDVVMRSVIAAVLLLVVGQVAYWWAARRTGRASTPAPQRADGPPRPASAEASAGE